MNKIIQDFVEVNDNGEVSDSTLWEALKATMRGYIISYESSKKREKNIRKEELQREIKQIEETHINSLLQSDYNRMLKLKHEYNSILQEDVSSLLLKNKQKHLK